MDSGYLEITVDYYYVAGFDEGLQAVRAGLAEAMFPVNSAMPLVRSADKLAHEPVFAEPIYIMFNPSVLRSSFDFASSQLLALWPCLVLVVCTMLAGGVAMWLVEGKEGQTGLSSPEFFKGVSHGAWFTMTTITTVGYGDLTPRTWIGRIMTIMWMIVGTVLMSLITALITTSLSNYQAVAVNYPAFLLEWANANQHIGTLRNTRANSLLNAHYEAAEYLIVFEQSLTMCNDFRSGRLHAIMAELAVLNKCRSGTLFSGEDVDVNSGKNIYLLEVSGGAEEYEIHYYEPALEQLGLVGRDIVQALSRVSMYMIADDLADGSTSNSITQESQAELALNAVGLLLGAVMIISLIMAGAKHFQRWLRENYFMADSEEFSKIKENDPVQRLLRYLCCVDLRLFRWDKGDHPNNKYDRTSSSADGWHMAWGPEKGKSRRHISRHAVSTAEGAEVEMEEVTHSSNIPRPQLLSRDESKTKDVFNPIVLSSGNYNEVTIHGGGEGGITEIFRRHATERMELAKRHEMDIARYVQSQEATD